MQSADLVATSSYEKDSDNVYLTLSEMAATLSGLTEPFHPSMKLTNHDLPVLMDIADDVDKEEQLLLKGKSPRLIQSWVKTEHYGLVFTSSMVSRTERDTLVGNTKVVSASVLHPLWYKHLDFTNKRLYAPKYDVYISARDIQLLRFMLMGWSRKKMADALSVSVKTLERRLTQLRAFSVPEGKPMEQHMAEAGLSAFILGNPDWFSENSLHVVG
jgi:hypothetical protein